MPGSRVSIEDFPLEQSVITRQGPPGPSGRAGGRVVTESLAPVTDVSFVLVVADDDHHNVIDIATEDTP